MSSHKYEFDDIAPYYNGVFNTKIQALASEPRFEHVLRSVFPTIDFEAFANQLRLITTKEEFQEKVIRGFLEEIVSRTTSGLTASGLENISADCCHTFITNHRDIVLDASFLNLSFLRHGCRTSEVAIGDNLLIYDWITNLVKLNGSFIVKRNLRITQALEAAKQLSAYIHFAISEKKESVWIAQREGRAKDSSDNTQESVVKMLSLGGEGTMSENLAALNIVPVAISYEYDPNDYLKAKEFLLKHRNPEFKKSQEDDLIAMETGMMGYKGRVHVGISHPISNEIKAQTQGVERQEIARRVCAIIDCGIHSSYELYPVNYVAYDLAFNTDRFSSEYTFEDRTGFEEYIDCQLNKIKIDDVTDDERSFMLHKMYEMYANPVKNQIEVLAK